MQRFGLFICTQSALRVSGDVFAHHQEHLTLFRSTDIVHPSCCRIRSCKYSQVLLMMGENIIRNM